MISNRSIDAQLLNTELEFSASRSDGPGGQNVNKVNTKITLRFDVAHSAILTQEEKDVLLRRLATQLTKDGVLILQGKESRSQLQNKESVILKLENLLRIALTPQKARKKTRVSKSAKEKRIQGKKIQGEKKKWRQKP